MAIDKVLEIRICREDREELKTVIKSPLNEKFFVTVLKTVFDGRSHLNIFQLFSFRFLKKKKKKKKKIG